MKKIFLVMTALMLSMMVFTACESDRPTNAGSGGNTTSKTVDKLPQKEKLAENADLTLEIKNLSATLESHSKRIDALVDSLSSKNQIIDELQKKINEQDEPSSMWNILTIISFVCSIIVIGILIYMQKNASDDNSIKNLILGDSRFKKLEHGVENLNSMVFSMPKGNVSDLSSICRDLNSRLAAVERTILDLERRNQHSGTLSPSIPSGSRHTGNKNSTMVKYVSNVSDGYFISVVESLQENSIFKITLSSASKGKFDIVDLNKIKQINQINDVVEIVNSSCRLSEAKTYRVNVLGICQLTEDGKAWRVVSPLKIQIS